MHQQRLACGDEGTHGHSTLVDDDLVEAGLDAPAAEVLELLAGLDEQVAARHGDGNALPRVARPDVQARVTRGGVDGEEVQVRVEAREDGVDRAVLAEVGRRGRQQMRAARDLVGGWRWAGSIPVFACVCESAGRQAETDCCHLCDALDAVVDQNHGCFDEK